YRPAPTEPAPVADNATVADTAPPEAPIISPPIIPEILLERPAAALEVFIQPEMPAPAAPATDETPAAPAKTKRGRPKAKQAPADAPAPTPVAEEPTPTAAPSAAEDSAEATPKKAAGRTAKAAKPKAKVKEPAKPAATRRGRPPATNRLGHETSPYLLQHAHNPVDWYPWGPEALAQAQAEQKPIIVSIGYAACHWCHVMERESFENEQAYAGEHRAELEGSAERFAQVLQTSELEKYGAEGDATSAHVTDEEFKLLAYNLGLRFDRERGGTNHAPKFPMPSIWRFLLRTYHITGSQNMLNQVNLTLREIAWGGIYDQVGGGFARYSVDAEWLVPHF
nr:spermatogenesis-associated protein 20-like [Tanacetum cinerariifolium]